MITQINRDDMAPGGMSAGTLIESSIEPSALAAISVFAQSVEDRAIARGRIARHAAVRGADEWFVTTTRNLAIWPGLAFCS